MKGHHSSLGRLPSKAFWLGSTLALATLTVLSLPASAEKADLKMQPNGVDQTLVKQQRKGRWIKIDLSAQRLSAMNGKTLVRAFLVSTGKRRTPTPTGSYAIQSKFRSTRMQGEDYNVPNVPHAMYFSGGYAIHGAYWHNRFGTPVSHGCVNMRESNAAWLYNWAPIGTPVVVDQ
ncbi:MAG TPA: L,D-transpeptidase [Coleofasciculaceae cyanobacterium]|jgi:lipoprotein-anchoring transpeptidase ErfK/SrfK